MNEREPRRDGFENNDDKATGDWIAGNDTSAGGAFDQLRALASSGVGRTIFSIIFFAVAYYYLSQPNNPAGHDNIQGFVLQSQGKLDEAIAEYDTAIRLAPNWYNPYMGRGSVYRLKGNLDRSLADLNRSIELNADYPDSRHERGLTWRAKGNNDRALADFSEAIRLKPEFAPPYYERAMILRDQHAIESAMADLDRALERQKKSTWFIARAEINFFELKRLPQAADDFAAAAHEAISYRDMMKLLDAAAPEQAMPQAMMDYKVPFHPTGYYLLLWAHYARAQARQDDSQEMAALVKDLAHPIWRELWSRDPMGDVRAESQKRALAPWPGAIYGLFLGKATPEDVRAAAALAVDDGEKRRRMCDADFYLAVFARQKGDSEEALRLLQSAAELCPATSLEAKFAKAALKPQGG